MPACWLCGICGTCAVARLHSMPPLYVQLPAAAPTGVVGRAKVQPAAWDAAPRARLQGGGTQERWRNEMHV